MVISKRLVHSIAFINVGQVVVSVHTLYVANQHFILFAHLNSAYLSKPSSYSHSFTDLFIFIKDILSTYYVQGIGDTTVNQTFSCFPHGTYYLVGKIDFKQLITQLVVFVVCFSVISMVYQGIIYQCNLTLAYHASLIFSLYIIQKKF